MMLSAPVTKSLLVVDLAQRGRSVTDVACWLATVVDAASSSGINTATDSSGC